MGTPPTPIREPAAPGESAPSRKAGRKLSLSEAIQDPLRLSGRLTVLAAILSLAIAAVPPIVYATALRTHLQADLSAEADLMARLLHARLGAAPTRASPAAASEVLAGGGPPRSQASREFLAADGAVVARSGPAPGGFALAVREERELADGSRYATTAALAPVLEQSLWVAAASALAGLVLFAGLHHLPLCALRRAERDIAYLENHDSLTCLPNRALFADRLARALQRARRDRTKVGLFYLDLDRFKSVNDSLGQDAGDQVLVQAVTRLAQRIRSSDTLARISGDEFVVVAEGGHRPEDFLEFARHLRAGFEAPFAAGGREIDVTFSCGVALFPDDAATADLLLRNADLALDDAKQHGRDNVRFFTHALSVEMERRTALHLRLRHALSHGEFRVHYQPIHCAASGATCGFEALLRWEREPGRLVGPDDFIAGLEESGLIVPVGEWVIDQACGQLAAWSRQGRDDIAVSVNVSGRQFHEAGLVEAVRGCLERHAVAPGRLVVEITESILLDASGQAEAQLRELAAQGVRLSLDDFGTGWSSLSYLQRFPINCLKIDRSFVAPLARGGSDSGRRIVEAIIGLAHGLGLRVTAEGIESPEQLEILLELSCDRFQGHYFGAPALHPDPGAGRAPPACALRQAAA